MKIKTIITDPRLAEMPAFATKGSAAVDLCAMIDVEHPQMKVIDEKTTFAIHPGQTVMISTGLKIFIENPKYAGFVMARSGLSAKKGLAPANKVGLIDSDYQGPLMVALHNSSGKIQVIEQGERIAQLLIVPVVNFVLAQVKEFKTETDRGEGGFGSTGAE